MHTYFYILLERIAYMKPERMISEAEARSILKNGQQGVLCTVSADGMPYGVPLNYCYNETENAVYFHCAVSGKKMDNMLADNRVSFVVTGRSHIVAEKLTTHYESVIISGCASLVTADEEKLRVLHALCQHLTPSVSDSMICKRLDNVAIVYIRISSISGKRNPQT